jgi:hypothetical protein
MDSEDEYLSDESESVSGEITDSDKEFWSEITNSDKEFEGDIMDSDKEFEGTQAPRINTMSVSLPNTNKEKFREIKTGAYS